MDGPLQIQQWHSKCTAFRKLPDEHFSVTEPQNTSINRFYEAQIDNDLNIRQCESSMPAEISSCGKTLRDKRASQIQTGIPNVETADYSLSDGAQ